MAAVTIRVDITEWLCNHVRVSQAFIFRAGIAAMATGAHVLIKMNLIPFTHCRDMTIWSMAGEAGRFWRNATICRYMGW
jgi:hypothetical protein